MIEYYGTLGPACAKAEILENMFRAGMSGIRLNLSHTTLEKSRQWIELFHTAAERCEKKGSLLIDMQGPELRIKDLAEPLKLEEGTAIPLSSIPFSREVTDHLEDGDTVLLDDGKLELAVQGKNLLVMRGGTLTSRKSVKIVGRDINLPALTETDRVNLSLAKEMKVAAVMQPFVRGADDIREVRRELAKNGCEDIRIFSKIESRTGLSHLDEIISASDMIVIARGDLGNDVPLCELPGVQKDIAGKCRAKNVPFLVVTQMLTSMIHSPVPTRAEVSDIFNAVTDGASAVMVTNETAAGEHPAAVMKVLYDTGTAAERWLLSHPK